MLRKYTISQAGLFGDTIKNFAQQFLVVKKQMEVIKHILYWRGSGPIPALLKQQAPSAHLRSPGMVNLVQ